MVILNRESGGLLPRAQRKTAGAKLAPRVGWLRDRPPVKGDLTLDGMLAEPAAAHGVNVHRGSVRKSLQRLGPGDGKTLLASEILRPEVAAPRKVWVEVCRPSTANLLESAVFIDETSLKADPVKTTGRAPVGKRLINHAPFGHRHTPH